MVSGRQPMVGALLCMLCIPLLLGHLVFAEGPIGTQGATRHDTSFASDSDRCCLLLPVHVTPCCRTSRHAHCHCTGLRDSAETRDSSCFSFFWGQSVAS